jgi:hypothetical protein
LAERGVKKLTLEKAAPRKEPMSQRRKLIERIRNNPRDVRFEEACKAAASIALSMKTGRIRIGCSRGVASPCN